MKYNDFYFWMFKSPMKKVLAEKYGREYAADIMKKSKKVYRELVGKAADIGDDNPMAYNELFALAFVAPYIASGKKIPPETVQEMMRRSLYHIKWYFAKTDLNTDKGKAENKKSIVKYVKWYTPEKEKQYPTSFKVDFEGQPHEGACYYRITRCPHLRLCGKAGRFRVDAAVLRVGRGDDHTPARRAAQKADVGKRRRILRLLHYRKQRINEEARIGQWLIRASLYIS